MIGQKALDLCPREKRDDTANDQAIHVSTRSSSSVARMIPQSTMSCYSTESLTLPCLFVERFKLVGAKSIKLGHLILSQAPCKSYT